MVSQSEMPSSNFPERGFLCQQNPLSGNLDSQEPPTEKSVHHILCSAHQKCCRAHFQGGGSCASGTASPEIWTRSEKRAVSGGKTQKKLPKFFLRLQDTYKKYILQKKMGQNGHSSPQQWSEQSTHAYMGLPPPTR